MACQSVEQRERAMEIVLWRTLRHTGLALGLS